jgi:hypothetical protein
MFQNTQFGSIGANYYISITDSKHLSNLLKLTNILKIFE